jgi:hypothetical protein
MADDDHGLRLRQVTDVTANDREVRLARCKSLGGSSAVPLSMTLKRTGALVATSWLAMADMALAASPSIDPTATLSVTGRV